MLNRLTVSSLIQSVIVLMSACVIALLCISAWDSWERLAITGRISVVADASANLFKAMQKMNLSEREKNETLGRLGEARVELLSGDSDDDSDAKPNQKSAPLPAEKST